MLLKIITVISLFIFLLLMISGAQTEVALYRSIISFMILFSGVYLTIFFLNVIKDDSDSVKQEVKTDANEIFRGKKGE